MPYKGSYIWKIRQKIGHDLLLMPSADALAVNQAGEILLVFNKDFNNWFIPGGYAEEGQSSAECAARELLEEGGLRADPVNLVPFAFMSGHTVSYPGGDATAPFTQYFFTEQWTDAGDILDVVEVSKRQWVSLEDAKKLDLTPYMLRILEAYEIYRQTGQYQMLTHPEREV